MNQQKFGIRIWLWIILAVVMVAALGLGGWYFFDQKGKTTVKTSPTPTKSAAVSPSPAAGTTSTPVSSTKTSTPSTTSTPTPLSSPPAGWKSVENEITGFKTYTGPKKYRVFIKDEWDLVPANYINYYGVTSECSQYSEKEGKGCAFQITYNSISSDQSSKHYEIPVPNTSFYLAIDFFNISESDKTIVKQSFTVQ